MMLSILVENESGEKEGANKESDKHLFHSSFSTSTMGIQHSTHPSDKILWARRKQELDLRRSGEISRSPSTQRKCKFNYHEIMLFELLKCAFQKM
jgi:hypothetical protein